MSYDTVSARILNNFKLQISSLSEFIDNFHPDESLTFTVDHVVTEAMCCFDSKIQSNQSIMLKERENYDMIKMSLLCRARYYSKQIVIVVPTDCKKKFL